MQFISPDLASKYFRSVCYYIFRTCGFSSTNENSFMSIELIWDGPIKEGYQDHCDRVILTNNKSKKEYFFWDMRSPVRVKLWHFPRPLINKDNEYKIKLEFPEIK